MMKRIPSTASSMLRHRGQCQRSLSAASSTLNTGQLNPIHVPTSYFSSWQPFFHQARQYSSSDNANHFSSLANDSDDGINQGGGKLTSLFPTAHSRSLPPPVCPPTHLRSEVESIFDAPVGSLIIYRKSEVSSEVKSVEEEMADAYYAADAVVQRVEYIMRGMNAVINNDSFVSKSVRKNEMALKDEVGGGELMAKDECFRAMLDLTERMAMEGQTYEELRTRIRSQILDPSAVEDSSTSDSSSSSDSDNDEELSKVAADEADKSFDKWAESMEENMSKAGISNFKRTKTDDKEDDEPVKNQEEYQFGATPGTTTHMYDLVLDSLACLCQEQSEKGASAFAEILEVMPKGLSPPELAKEILDEVLNRHWKDGGDIGVGNGGSDNSMDTIGKGVGSGAGTGAGNLADQDLSTEFDIRTCPTPMSFNAVLRITANFDPIAYTQAVENAKVLGGDMGNASRSTGGNNANQLKEDQERLRDITIDAAFSTYSRMQYCSALTLQTLKNSTKKATSRHALKRQARLLSDTHKGKRKNEMISGRNSATYAYLIQSIGKCFPPSLSRGNMAFGIYHTGCVQEGLMDEGVVKAMMGLGGYAGGIGGVDALVGGEGDVSAAPAPPVSNGPLFDAYMQKELGSGVALALAKGSSLQQNRNYKMRRHVQWDDTY